MASEATDKELVEAALARINAGDPDGYRPLVERYQRPLFRVLRRYTDNEADALDLVQRALVKAYRELANLSNAAAFKGWLFRIGVNLALNQRRSRQRRPTSPLEDAPERSVAPQAERNVEIQQEYDRVVEALDCLSPTQREVLLLRVEGELSYKEIAATADTTAGAARVHFHNAIKRLKRQLAAAEERAGASSVDESAGKSKQTAS